jgi:hypothetical protein
MDNSYLTAVIGLAGAAIGGLTTFGSSWVTHRAQSQARAREVMRTRRERLYTAFIDEAARLYGDALSHEKDDVTDLVQLYAILARMRLLATGPVIAAGEEVIRRIVQAYQAPNRSLHELRLAAGDHSMDPLLEFSEACRAELD